jgi:hypothetical protein
MTKRLVLAAVLLALVAPVVAIAFSYRSIVRRIAMRVEDLPPYGTELKSLDPYRESPAAPDPLARTPYSGPGWYVRQSPGASYRAFTTSWGGVVGEVLLGLVVDRAFYHTVGVWDESTGSPIPVVSIKEADPHSGISHRYAWSRDSEALLIHGRGRLPDDYESVVNLCLVYLPRQDKLYRLAYCSPQASVTN